MYGDEASVVCSEILLNDCMDLLDTRWSNVLGDVYNSFLAKLKAAGIPLPIQSSGAHRLDREVLNYAIGVLEEKNFSVRCVRAVFKEGKPVFPGSALSTLDHIQIAVRDTILIKNSWEIKKGEEYVLESRRDI